MSTRVVDRVDDWEQRPFSGGFGGLSDLAAEEFSGVVRAGGAEVYVTGGTVVAVRRGALEDVEDASGTVFEAPEPALPLLAVMQEADADVRAEYYSEETPISEVDATLSDGGFTGFLELSENVLSGDYYVVYHGGSSTSLAFVGASEQLVTGDEAFETADDEVGIYRVRQVDVEPIEVPEPTGSAAETDDAAEPEAAAGADDAAEPEAAAGADDEAEPDESEETTAPAAEEAASSAPEPAGDAEAGAPAEEEAATGGAAGAPAPEPTGGGETRTDAVDEATATTETSPESRPDPGQAGDLETRGVPSLDPDQTTYPQRPSGSAAGGGTDPSSGRQRGSPRAGGAGDSGRRRPAPGGGEAGQGARAASADLAELESDLAEREAEIENLEAELEAARSDRDEIEAELERVREERDELESETERLREELGRLEEEVGAATDAERRMSPSEAIEGTNLFVDYESKGQATLEKAHGGGETREDLAENLQLGVHTEFDQASVAVGGTDFGEFLEETLEYRFAAWVVGQLLFEIRDTGHTEALQDLYDAIPEIRRVEFDGTIDAEYVEDGQEKAATERFDVVFRHRMGDPLLVADLNDSRDPATGGMMTSLVTAAERVGQTEESLAAAFLVTSSFFESEALETVTEATKGGILSRDKRRSFVNLSRKTGYHLCLVAAREGNFHMEVPEL